jgi:hypothetical protein
MACVCIYSATTYQYIYVTISSLLLRQNRGCGEVGLLLLQRVPVSSIAERKKKNNGA